MQNIEFESPQTTLGDKFNQIQSGITIQIEIKCTNEKRSKENKAKTAKQTQYSSMFSTCFFVKLKDHNHVTAKQEKKKTQKSIYISYDLMVT